MWSRRESVSGDGLSRSDGLRCLWSSSRVGFSSGSSRSLRFGGRRVESVKRQIEVSKCLVSRFEVRIFTSSIWPDARACRTPAPHATCVIRWKLQHYRYTYTSGWEAVAVVAVMILITVEVANGTTFVEREVTVAVVYTVLTVFVVVVTV